MSSTGKQHAGVVTLKDIEANQWYHDCGLHKQALQEGRSAANMPWTKVALWQGDIAKLEVDAIVNAAKRSLEGGGGVDGVIHTAAGPNLKEECKRLNGCAPGDAKITKGYNLPAKHVIHTVGPKDQDPEVLKSCYRSCLQLMTDHQLKSVAFPCIATGIYRFPNDAAADIALSITREWLEQHHADVEKIVFCVYDDTDRDLYKERVPTCFNPDGWNGGSSVGQDKDVGGLHKKALQEIRSAATMPRIKVTVWRRDITKMKVDAIVNAANRSLLGGTSVDGAIHKAAGPNLKEECRGLDGCKPGDAKITKGYNLPAKYVIHTVGPEDQDPEVLKSCYRRCFQLMTDHQLKSVAFPCIATGNKCFPKEKAADIALSIAREWLEQHRTDVEEIYFCVFTTEDNQLYNAKLPTFFSSTDRWSVGSCVWHEEATYDPSVGNQDVSDEAGSKQ